MIKELQIELTNACQGKCLMCAHKDMKRPVTHMELGLLEKIVAESKDFIKEPYLVGICGVGEPSLHPQYKECMEILKFIRFATGTNCSAFNSDIQDATIKAKFTDITLSLDAVSEEAYAKMRPGCDFNKSVENAIMFLKKLSTLKRFWRSVFVQIIPTRANFNEVWPFINFWGKHILDLPGAVIFVKPMYKWPNVDNPWYPADKFAGEQHPKIQWGPQEDTTFRKTCNLFDDWAMIQSDGAYQPCCMPVEDDYQVGNVKNNTIAELYKSPRMVELRKLKKEGRIDEIPFCKNCI